VSVLASTRREDATVYHLPGRDWLLLMGPGICDVKNLTLGASIFPPGSAPSGHIHDAEEEVIYVVSGHGELRTPEGSVPLEPGTCVYVPIGLHHATASHGPGPLELVTAFSPPVVPGAYETGKK
jgi:mannose-6-phosphate isomerase-like protein (cupin superfamily)